MKIKKSIFIRLSIYLMALRSPLIIVTIMTYMVSKDGMIKNSIFKIIPFLIFLIVAMIYSIALGNDIGNVIGQARDILLALIVAIFLIASSSVSDSNRVLVYKTIKKCFLFIAIAKIFILVFSVSSGVPMGDIISWLRDAWGIQMMSLGVEGTFISRLQIPLDSAVPFFIYFVTKELIHCDSGKSKSIITLSLLVISMILTLSRAFWAETLLMLSLAIMIEARFSKIMKITITTTFIFGLLYILTPIGDIVGSIIATRFGNASNNSASDALRIWQNRALIGSFLDRPIFGHGIGYYIPNKIRSYTIKYLYESQVLSLLMQMGIVGCFSFMVMLVSMCMSTVMVEGGRGVKKYFIPFIFLSMWVFSGSVNPLLFGAAGGLVIYMTAKFHSIYINGDS